jgi:hypothetical protein
MKRAGHILVAEDDPTDAFFFERAFKRAGIPVKLKFVKHGQAVVDYLEGHSGNRPRRTAAPRVGATRPIDAPLEWLRGSGVDSEATASQKPDGRHFQFVK